MKLPTSSTTDIYPHTAKSILSGEPHILSYPRTGQYAQQGSSSCGLAALNSARCLLSKAQSNTQTAESFLQSLVTRESVEEIMSICHLWTSDLHLEVEEIAKIPLFSHALKLVNTGFGACKTHDFKRLLSKQFAALKTPAAALLTRPPEILTCLCLPLPSSPDTPLYILFDSHPRPSHPSGSGFLFSTSLDAIASHLGRLLSVDSTLFTDSAMQWEAQYLTQFSSHLFVPVSQPQAETQEGLRRLVLESSLAAMEMRGRIRDMEWRLEFMSRENARLEAEVAASERRRLWKEEEEKEQEEGFAKTFRSLGAPPRNQCPATSSEEPSPVSPKLLSERAAGKQRETLPDPSPSSPSQKTYATTVAGPSRPRDAINHTSTSGVTSGLAEPNDDWLLLKFNPEGHVRQLHLSSGPTSDTEYAVRLQEWYNSDDPHPPSNSLSSPPSAPSDDILYALREQQRFNDEHVRLQAERSALARFCTPTFKCGICMEVFMEDMVTRVPGCQHMFCRGCLKSFVSFKLKEHRFPMFCPQCTAGGVNSKGAEPSAIDNLLAQQIGITEEENAVWHELELARVSVLLSCRKCKRSAFVDREEHDIVKVIACPLPGCRFLWCKICQQQVLSEGPMHSCDGTSELDHLMKTKGWKYCPGCRTPIQKMMGCNHMTCLSPGCNMHFCYLCGEKIVQSGLGLVVKGAVTAHYSKCQLFEFVSE